MRIQNPIKDREIIKRLDNFLSFGPADSEGKVTVTIATVKGILDGEEEAILKMLEPWKIN
ncbi:MAG: hypothetical protein HQM13_21350 [SAR324 cluster bacterium]|nr:hypothetical protein [SAR324 cluster bacterium]